MGDRMETIYDAIEAIDSDLQFLSEQDLASISTALFERAKDEGWVLPKGWLGQWRYGSRTEIPNLLNIYLAAIQ